MDQIKEVMEGLSDQVGIQTGKKLNPEILDHQRLAEVVGKCCVCLKSELNAYLFCERETGKLFCEECAKKRSFDRWNKYLRILETEPEKVMERIGINEAYRDATLEKYNHPKYLEIVKGLKAEVKEWPVKKFITFVGMNGSGKTFYSVAFVRELLQTHKVHYRKVCYTKASEMIQNINDSMYRDDITFDIWFYKMIPLLILDDLVATKITERAKSLFFELIDYRYESKLGTVITVDVNAEAMASALEYRVVSRIYGGMVFEFPKIDWRIKK